MFLFVDTGDSQKVILSLFSKDKFCKKSVKNVYRRQSEKFLPFLKIFLKEEKLKASDLKGIVVMKGPGGFSALRVGIAAANAMSYALKIPVGGILKDEIVGENLLEILIKKISLARVGDIIEPAYGKEPNITVSNRSNWNK